MDKGSSQLFEKMAIEGHYCPLKRLTEDTWISFNLIHGIIVAVLTST